MDAFEVVKVVVVEASELDVVVVLWTVVLDRMLLVVVVTDVLFTELLEADPLDPGTMAELVTVATLLLCATLLGNPEYSVGPGMV